MPKSLTEEIHLRFRHMQRTQQRPPRQRRNLVQLGARGGYVPAPAKGSQSVVVKSSLATGRTTQGHLRYLERGKGPDRTDADLFTAPGREIDRTNLVQAAQSDPHQWRIIVSPAASSQLDMRQFVQRWVQQVEQDTRRTYDWVGAVHHDTDHIHAHVLIRGRDLQGMAVYFDKAYLRTGMRYRAAQLATRQLGPVVQELARQRARGVARQHAQELGKEQGMGR